MGFIANSAFSCFSISKNVGKPDCDFNWEAMAGFFLVPYADALTQAEADAGITTIQARCINNSYAARWHMVGPVEDVQDKTDDPTEAETGNKGNKVITDEGQSGLEFMISKGGFEHVLDLMSFNHLVQTYKIVPFDELGQCMMRWNATTSKYEGLRMDEFFVPKPKFKTAKTPLTYRIIVRFTRGPQLTTELRAVLTEADLASEIQTVNDVVLSDVSVSLSAGVFDIRALDHSVNLGGTIGSTAAATTVFKAKLKTTGAALAATGCTLTTVAGQPAYQLVLNTGGSGYTAGQTAVIYWANVSTLAGISDSLKYFETNHPNKAFTSGQLEVILT